MRDYGFHAGAGDREPQDRCARVSIVSRSRSHAARGSARHEVRKNLAETYDQHHTIESFLAAAAAKQPAPGGGSVAALAGALAASMGEMVINYSLGKKNLAAYES